MPMRDNRSPAGQTQKMDQLADVAWNLFQAFTRRGFTEDQALKVLASFFAPIMDKLADQQLASRDK